MVGEKHSSNISTYELLARLNDKEGENAEIYVCRDTTGQEWIMKRILGPAQPERAGSVYNHYGRMRDANQGVFEELKQITNVNSFLVKFHDRLKVRGRWAVIMERVNGLLMDEYIRKIHDTTPNAVDDFVGKFALCVSGWHKKQFAHGDPHLRNVMVEEPSERIVPIDYCHLHHRTFKYCLLRGCFEPANKRTEEDLYGAPKMGPGFYNDLKRIGTELLAGSQWAEIFLKTYREDQLTP